MLESEIKLREKAFREGAVFCCELNTVKLLNGIATFYLRYSDKEGDYVGGIYS